MLIRFEDGDDKAEIAKDLAKLGMTLANIEREVQGYKKGAKPYVNKSLQFIKGPKGVTSEWLRSKIGSEYSSLLIHWFRRGAQYPDFSRRPSAYEIINTWKMVTLLHPEMIENQICDINRFYAILQMVVNGDIVHRICATEGCNDVLYAYRTHDRRLCLSCRDLGGRLSVSNKSQSTEIEKIWLKARAEKNRKSLF